MNEHHSKNQAPSRKQQAYAALQAGDLSRGRALFEEAAGLSPDDAEAWFMQGSLAGQLGDLPQAEACFRQAAKLQPDRPEVRFNLAKALEAQGQPDAALEHYREVLRLKPDVFAAHAQIANLLQGQGRLEEALASQRETVRLAPAMAEGHYNLGNILQEMGHHSEAEAAFRESLRLNPVLAEAWHNLGNVLNEQHRFAEAEAACREALKLNPALAAAQLSLGNALHRLERLPEAEAAYRRAVELKPDYDEALNNLGNVLMDTARLDEAGQCYEAALAHRPSALVHCNLGNLRLQQQRLDEAVQLYHEALALDPARAEVYNNLGNALRQQGHHADAQAAYREALRLNPDYVEAHSNLGTVLTEAGQLEEALSAYRRALVLRPDFHRAVAGEAGVLEKQGRFDEAYARLAPFLDGGEADVNMALAFAGVCRPLGRCAQAVELLERLLSGEGQALEIYDRIMVHFSLGRLLDAAGEYERAFSHYRQGNDLAHRRFDLQAHVRRTEAFMGTYSKAFLARAPRAAQRSERPVFIVGMPRSGTSLVEQILASHPDVFGAGELNEMHHIVADLAAEAPYPGCVESLGAERLGQLARRYLDYIGALAGEAPRRVTDKMPGNFLHLGLIALLFPGARIIHCVRDPLDTCLSCYFQHFAEGQPYTYDLAHLGAYYRQYRRLMDHWREVLDVPMLEVRYEDLVGDQEGGSRRLVEFCGLAWDERCLSFHETRRVVATASYDQVRRPMYKSSMERWRHYENHLGPLRKALTEPTIWESPAPKAAAVDVPEATCQDKKQQAYARLQAGDWHQAERLYAEACRLDPEDAEAHYNLGTVSKELGHYEEALAAYREALRLRPDAVAALHNMGTVLAELDRLDEAARYFEAALARQPNAMSHSNLGNVYTRQQRLDEAVSQYRQALALDPGMAQIYNNLGGALRHQGNYRDALAAFEQAVQLNPDYGEAYINLGSVLLHLRRMNEARAAYRRALELDPESRKAVAGEASVLEKQGDFEQAYERLRPFLEAGEVEVNIAQVLAALGRPLGRSTEAVTMLEQVLAGEGTSALSIYDRVLVHFSLGRLLDAAHEYDRAFSHYQQGNRLAKQHFDPQDHEAYIDTLIDTFTSEFMARAPRAGASGDRPVFIVGMPRSGTSLVEQILASHPQVFGAGELEEIGRIALAVPATVGASAVYPRCLDSLTDRHCDQLAGRYLNHIAELAPPDVLRVTDKMPPNFLHLGLIALLFPEARIIHCVRNPLDTCLSCYFQNFSEGHPYTYDLAHLGFYYRQYQRLMTHWRKVLTVPIMEVHYETLIGDQEGVSRVMIEFCGLDWDERCLRFHETKRVVATASYDQVRQPVYSASKARWRHYEAHLEPLRRALDSTPHEPPDAADPA